MAIIYYPLSSEILRRTTVGSNYTEVVIGTVPNSIFFFDTGSQIQSLTASYLDITASWSSRSVSASYALNGGGSGVTDKGSYNISASWASSSISASYLTGSNFRVIGGELQLQGNPSRSWFRLDVYEDPFGVGSLQLTLV